MIRNMVNDFIQRRYLVLQKKALWIDATEMSETYCIVDVFEFLAWQTERNK